MKLTALLSFFDEAPEDLAALVRSLSLVDVDCLVCLDGAYGTFPGAKCSSGREAHDALRTTAAEQGLEFHLTTPIQLWETEVQKRCELFIRGEQTKPDWYFVVDGDEEVAHAFDAKRRLEATDQDAGTATLKEAGRSYPLRMFFRAIPGLRVKGAHNVYVTPGGRRLWGGHPMVPALDLTDLTILHKPRAEDRRKRALAYYRHRDEQGIERGGCGICGIKATKEIPCNWRPHPTGLTSDWLAVCDRHADQVQAQNRRTLESYGLNPDLIRVTFRPVEESLVST